MIWNYCLNLPLKSQKAKRYIFIGINMLIAALIGFILWNILRVVLIDFDKTDWLILLIGYPAVISYIYSIIYLFKHDESGE